MTEENNTVNDKEIGTTEPTHYLKAFWRWVNSFWGVFWVLGILGNWVFWRICNYSSQIFYFDNYYTRLLNQNIFDIWSLIYLPIILVIFMKYSVDKGDKIALFIKVISIAGIVIVTGLWLAILFLTQNLPCADDNLHWICIIRK